MHHPSRVSTPACSKVSVYIEDFEPEDEVEEQDGVANDEPNDEADDHAEED